MTIEFTLNNKKKKINVPASARLLDVLRDKFALTSPKDACGEGECGACMVLVNGRAMNSCLIAAGSVSKKSVITLEGFKLTQRYKMIEAGLLEAGAVQCGFCTPGFVISIESLLNQNPHPRDEEIREALSGNLCRCTGYNMIIQGVRIAIEKGDGLW
ncbi:MAG: (2Fe-2S)-binding protein [Fidelibacterota bacterium]